MKVFLVQPDLPPAPTELSRRLLAHLADGWRREAWYEQVPLALLIAARYFPEAQLHVESMDGPFVPREGMDLVLMTAITRQVSRAYALAAACRSLGVPVGLGGVHASARVEEAAGHVDFVFCGEMEGVLPQFVDDFRRGRAQPVYGPEDPKDAWHASPLYRLLDPARVRHIPLQTSRGCGRDCSFCIVPGLFGRRLRRKSDEQIAAELAEIRRLFPDPSRTRLLLVDDNLFLEPDGLDGILDLLSETGYSWATYSDISLAGRPEWLARAVASGLDRVFCGLESLQAESLGGVSRFKAALLPEYARAVHTIQQAGAGVFASFVLGFDGDDRNSAEAIIHFLEEQPLYRAAFGLLVPYPGTPLFSRFQAEERLQTLDWNRYHEWDLVFRHPCLDERELTSMILQLHDQFYSTAAARKRIRYFKNIRGNRR